MSLFFAQKHLHGTAPRRAMHARARNLQRPTTELAIHLRHVLLAAASEEVVLHVLHTRLDFPFLLGCARRRRVDAEVVVPCDLAVAAVQLRQTAHAKRCTNHRRLQVVRYDHARHAAKPSKRSLMQLQPRRRALVENHFAVLMAAVPQHHYENPSFAQRPCRRIPQLSRVSEVHLRNVARLRVDRNRHILGAYSTAAADPADHSLQSADAALVVWVLEPQTIVNGLRTESLLEQYFHRRLPLFELRYLLWRWPWRQRLHHNRFQHFERRQLVRAALQHSGFAECTTVLLRCVPSDAQLLRCSPLRQPQSVQSHQLLQSMHIRPPRAHLSVQASFAQTFLAPCRPRPSLAPKPDPEWIRLADLDPHFARFPPPPSGSAWPISGGSVWPIPGGSAWPIARGSHRPIRDTLGRRTRHRFRTRRTRAVRRWRMQQSANAARRAKRHQKPAPPSIPSCTPRAVDPQLLNDIEALDSSPRIAGPPTESEPFRPIRPRSAIPLLPRASRSLRPRGTRP